MVRSSSDVRVGYPLGREYHVDIPTFDVHIVNAARIVLVLGIGLNRIPVLALRPAL